MASGHPKIGSTNGVDLLDFGQIGGSRNTAGTAQLAVLGTGGTTRTQGDMVNLPEAGARFHGLVGTALQQFTFTGIIYGATVADLDTIEAEIGSYLDGHRRDADGTVTVKMENLASTLATDPGGTRTWAEARLVDYQPEGHRQTLVSGGKWAVAQRFRMVVERLK